AVALLGPNGAGKTTVVEILEGHRTADAGRVSVLGHDPRTGGRAFRERIGVVLQEAGFEEAFTPRELLRLQAGYFPNPRAVDEVIELTGLDDKADARVKTLSGGQRRRLDLALGIIGRPDLLFLDEPTTGFDPSARRRAWDLVHRLRDLGATILLTTHYLDEDDHRDLGRRNARQLGRRAWSRARRAGPVPTEPRGRLPRPRRRGRRRHRRRDQTRDQRRGSGADAGRDGRRGGVMRHGDVAMLG